MNEEIIFLKIKHILEELGYDTSKMEMSSDFADDLGLDSISEVELVMAFEKELGQEIPSRDEQLLKTVRDAVEYLKGRIG